jgi:hypothetical protein
VLLDLYDRVQPDLVIHEMTNTGAAIAADLVGVRSIAFGLGLWNPFIPSLYEVAIADQADRWRSAGRIPGALETFPGGYFDVMPPSMQLPGPLPASRLPIRSVPWAPPGAVPAWLDAPATRPRVYLTLGTVSFGAVEVLRRAVLETAAHDVDVLVAVGPEGDPALLGELPSNVHTERFVPQADVLTRVDLVVHHGGAGTTLGAVANGLPQLILPQGADQPFNAAAIQRVGAGRALTNDEQVPGAIGEAVGATGRRPGTVGRQELGSRTGGHARTGGGGGGALAAGRPGLVRPEGPLLEQGGPAVRAEVDDPQVEVVLGHGFPVDDGDPRHAGVPVDREDLRRHGEHLVVALAAVLPVTGDGG